MFDLETIRNCTANMNDPTLIVFMILGIMIASHMKIGSNEGLQESIYVLCQFVISIIFTLGILLVYEGMTAVGIILYLIALIIFLFLKWVGVDE